MFFEFLLFGFQSRKAQVDVGLDVVLVVSLCAGCGV